MMEFGHYNGVIVFAPAFLVWMVGSVAERRERERECSGSGIGSVSQKYGVRRMGRSDVTVREIDPVFVVSKLHLIQKFAISTNI